VPSNQKRLLKKNFICPFIKIILKIEFGFDPGEHSLQVLAKSSEGSGCSVEMG
jgi:hypothetical protein